MKLCQTPFAWIAAVAAFSLFATIARAEDRRGSDADRDEDGPGAVFVISNASSGNAVIRYARAGNGSLTPAGMFATGGNGTGGGLGSQGAIIVSDDNHLLFTVNAGSNSITSFRIRPDGLERIDVVPSGGTLPTSVTYRHGILYVLNAGTPNNITGFEVDRHGRMTMLAASTRPLSAAATAPAQVEFSDDGHTLIVTERATNLIDVYTVDDDGIAAGPFLYPSAGPTPFGFAVNRSTLFVSEAGAGGGASTYHIDDNGLAPVSSNVMTGQRAACWAVITKNGRFGYVTNAGTGNISGFALRNDGSASLLDTDGVTAVTGGNPTDIATSESGRYLYVRVGALNSIAVFSVRADGSLVPLPSLTGTLAGLAGLAAY